MPLSAAGMQGSGGVRRKETLPGDGRNGSEPGIQPAAPYFEGNYTICPDQIQEAELQKWDYFRQTALPEEVRPLTAGHK